jgi:type VI secretion system protein ImpA
LIRINALAELAVSATIMVALKRQVLATTEDGQVLYLADLEIIYSAAGTAQSERRQLLSKLISPNCSVELVRSLGQINAIYRELNEINLCLEEKTAIHAISPLQNMSNSLRSWARVVEAHVRIVTPQLPVSAQPKAGNNDRQGNACESREDVVRALDAICAYYQQREPSSPVPFLLARVRRLTSMSFINIIAELAPDALSDLRRLGESSVD